MPSSLLDVRLIRGLSWGLAPLWRVFRCLKKWNFRLPLLRSCLLPALVGSFSLFLLQVAAEQLLLEGCGAAILAAVSSR